MSLRIIYGRTGTGKSTFCFNEIKTKINRNNKIYIITPEQYSLTQEQKLLESLKKNAVIDAEVLTFNRMAYRVMQEVGIHRTNLSKTGKSMLIYYILSQNKKDLTLLNKSDENIQTALSTIKELKKHNITVDALQQTIEKTSDQYLKFKLKDIYNIYKNYQETIKSNYIDEEDTLSILSQELDKTNMFKNTIIYIDEFVGYTKQEYEIIRKLLKTAKQVNITVCTDNMTKTTKTSDLFSANKETIEKIMTIANEEKIQVDSPINLTDIKRFKTEELKHLEKNLYSSRYQKYVKEPKDIELFLAKNPFSEIENIAKTIIKLVRDNKYNYQDIAIITKNIDTYAKIVKAVFKKYDIPIYIDEKKSINQNILIKYFLSIIEIFAKNWSYEAVFSYLKSGFIPISENDLFMLENYCIQYGIRGNKWYKEDWKIAGNDDELKKLNNLRKMVVRPLLKFKESLGRIKTSEEISKALYEFLIENKIDEVLLEKVKQLEEINELELASFYRASWDNLMDVLDEMIMVLGKNNISFQEYSKILKVGLQNSEQGTIPATCDQVIMGDVDRSRTHRVKAVFIIGLNDGIFPTVHKDEGFLNDKDRQDLKEQGVEIAKGTKELLFDDNFNIYKALLVEEEKLYLSYPSSDGARRNIKTFNNNNKNKKHI